VVEANGVCDNRVISIRSNHDRGWFTRESFQPNKDEAMRTEYDCVVMGAGPGGCSTATLVAEAGHSTLLVEREKMPRFHVGESLMPETYWTLGRLGVLEKMRERGFVRKVGVQFVNNTGKESQPFFFDEHDERDCSRTWHVERDRFDQMLFENAAEKGADCYDETRVLGVTLNPQSPHQVKLQQSNGTTTTVQARVVVDATGQSALLANRLGLREENRKLRKAAIWTYYRGAERCEDTERNTTVILHTVDKQAWFWYIPLADDIVSVGAVGDNDYMLKGRGTPAEIFAEELANCPAVARRVDGAVRQGDFHVAKEFSYTTKQQAGNGWVLVGDAFGFIDPIYSSGVFLALKSGEAAADAIVAGFQRNDLSPQQLGAWTHNFTQGGELIRKLVHAFYTNEFSFGMFMKDHPEHKGRLTDLLIGRVFEGDAGRIFHDLDPMLEKVEA
jgi:flavin-dependent dehydrogenase